VRTALRAAGMTLLVVVIGSCSMFDYSTIVSNKYAIIYGVTNYVPLNDPNLPTAYNDPNLSYPHLDAKDLSDMLTAKGYTVTSRWVDDQDNFYHDGVLATVAEAPSKANLSVDLAALKTKIKPDDVFVFYFSGHGTQSPDGTMEYFDPFGSVQYNPSNHFYQADPTTSVADTEMGSLLSANIGTARKVVILDSCNSGGFIGNTLEVDTMPSTTSSFDWTLPTPVTIIQAIENYARFTTTSTAVSPYNAQVLSAAGTDELSYDDSGHKHGAMTYYLLQIPTYGDLNNDGHVSVLEAFSFVKAQIQGNWNVVNPITEAFTPHVSGGPVDFILF